jgi:hypothetical protein
MTLVAEQLDRLAAYFATTPLKAVYVYGSYARGDADEHSDIDLLLETDGARRGVLDVARMRRELGALLSIPVDLCEHHKVLKYARAHIWRERVLIYRAA